MDDFKSENKPAAEESVKVRLVLETISKDAKIEVSEEDVKTRIAELAKTYGRKEDELLKNEELMEDVKSSLISEKTVDFLVENAKVKEVEAKEDECDCGHDHAKTTAKKKTTTKKETTKKAETDGAT